MSMMNYESYIENKNKNVWMDGFIDVCKDGYTWMYVRMDVWMDETK